MPENRAVYERAVRWFNEQMKDADDGTAYLHDVLNAERDVARLRVEKKALEDARDAVDKEGAAYKDLVSSISGADDMIRAAADTADTKRGNNHYSTVKDTVAQNRKRAREYLELARKFAGPKDAAEVKAMDKRLDAESDVFPDDPAGAPK